MSKEVRGNISGIRQVDLNELAQIYDIVLSRDEFINEDIVRILTDFTRKLGREIAIVLSRDGRVLDVSIGGDKSAEFSAERLTRGERRLSGVRCIHTHPNGGAELSDVDIGSLHTSKLDAMCAIAVFENRPSLLVAGFLGEFVDDAWTTRILGPVRLDDLDTSEWMLAIAQAEGHALADDSYRSVVEEQERAILVAVENGRETYDGLEELALLATTAGANVIGYERQKRDRPDNATYVGKGKLFDLVQMVSAQNVDLFIFDDELSAVQIRNLESVLGQRVIDRTALILDIFASRAQSREGKLQVELAQLKYRLPRPIGARDSLSRQAGGIGTRGPGEKKLETDRRRIRRHIFELQQELENVAKQRELRRGKRMKSALPNIALVGYTNAGKSTLLNQLSGSDVLAKDMLFATLDPVTRQVTWPNVGQVLISDTVGFINKLPHDLINAFRSTLEEAIYADVIIHVVDASSPIRDEQMKVVDEVLDSLNIDAETPMIIAYNKIDRCQGIENDEKNAVYLSAKTGQGIDALVDCICSKLSKRYRSVEFKIPYDRMEVDAFLRGNAAVLHEEYTEEGVVLMVNVSEAIYGSVKKMLNQEVSTNETL